MLDIIKKWINELVTSDILRERLKLIADKYSKLEEDNKHLNERNEELITKLICAKEEIEKLKGMIGSNNALKSEEELEQSEVDILKFFFESDQRLDANKISIKLQIPIGNTKHHIDNLLERELIYYPIPHRGDSTRYYIISTEGRAYIVKNT